MKAWTGTEPDAEDSLSVYRDLWDSEEEWQLRERMADLHDQARFVRTVLILLAVVALILLASVVAPVPPGGW